jgi:hypothetical protein
MYQPHEAENIAIYTGFNGRLPGWFRDVEGADDVVAASVR